MEKFCHAKPKKIKMVWARAVYEPCPCPAPKIPGCGKVLTGVVSLTVDPLGVAVTPTTSGQATAQRVGTSDSYVVTVTFAQPFPVPPAVTLEPAVSGITLGTVTTHSFDYTHNIAVAPDLTVTFTAKC